MAQTFPLPSDDRRAGFRVISSEDAPGYDTGEQTRTEPFVITDKEAGETILGKHGASAFAVYWHLCSRAKGGECWPSLDDIAEATCLSRMHVTRMLRLLEEGDWITRQQRTNRFGRATSTLYRITEKPRTNGCNIPVTSHEHDRNMTSPEMLPEQEENKIQTRSKRERVKTPPTPSTDQQFETEFWPRYPKGRGSKQDALRLWLALSQSDRDAAVAAIPLFVAGSDWQRGYHPAPEVWLRGRRWENPPEPAAPIPKPNGKAEHVGGITDEFMDGLRRKRLARQGVAPQDGPDVIEAGWR